MHDAGNGMLGVQFAAARPSSLPFYEHLTKWGQVVTAVVTGRLSTYDRQRFGRRFASFSGGENYHEYT
jgi:hypothetical protein